MIKQISRKYSKHSVSNLGDSTKIWGEFIIGILDFKNVNVLPKHYMSQSLEIILNQIKLDNPPSIRQEYRNREERWCPRFQTRVRDRLHARFHQRRKTNKVENFTPFMTAKAFFWKNQAFHIKDPIWSHLQAYQNFSELYICLCLMFSYLIKNRFFSEFLIKTLIFQIISR